MIGPAVLLTEKCPTGEHVGAVVAEYVGGQIMVPWPPRYECGCKDPRT